VPAASYSLLSVCAILQSCPVGPTNGDGVLQQGQRPHQLCLPYLCYGSCSNRISHDHGHGLRKVGMPLPSAEPWQIVYAVHPQASICVAGVENQHTFATAGVPGRWHALYGGYGNGLELAGGHFHGCSGRGGRKRQLRVGVKHHHPNNSGSSRCRMLAEGQHQPAHLVRPLLRRGACTVHRSTRTWTDVSTSCSTGSPSQVWHCLTAVLGVLAVLLVARHPQSMPIAHRGPSAEWTGTAEQHYGHPWVHPAKGQSV
jgi:hypothetical protein